MSTFPYFPTVPGANNDPGDDQPSMLTNASSISSLISIDHIGFNISGGGYHKQVTFSSNNVPSSFPISPPVLFTDVVAGLPQLKFFSGDAAHSSTQYVVNSNGSTFSLGGIIIKWGGANVSNGSTVNFVNAFPNNCFMAIPSINIGSTVSPVGTNGFSNSGFVFRTTAGGSVPITYIAIGN